MRKAESKVIPLVVMAAMVVVGLAVAGIATGAGDDCPPPSDGGNNEVYTPPPDDGNDDEEPEVSPEEGTSEDDGVLFGSMGSVSSAQLTIGILALVGVIGGAIYMYFAVRIGDDGEE